MKIPKSFLIASFPVILGVASAMSQQRAPATPLITHDPYFSVWSTTNNLTDSDTAHWTGSPQPISGIARIDGKAYRFMGYRPKSVPAMEQISSSIMPTHTRYRFSQSGIELELTFFTPAIMDDLDLLSRPVTYLTWTVRAIDGVKHQVSVLLDIDPVIAVNDRTQKVISSRHLTSDLNVLSVGSRDQDVLGRSGDNLRIDWGYFHLGVPKNEGSAIAISPHPEEPFIESGTLPSSDSIDMPQLANSRVAHIAAILDFSSVAGEPVSRHLLVSYTDGFAIQYLDQNLRPYWQRHGMTVAQMLDTAEEQYSALEMRGESLDRMLTQDLTKVGGEHYAAIAILAYRQTIAAHKLVVDVNGNPMLFSKENFSNGCIGTIDVTYPSSPFFLLLQPKLLEAELLPVFEYAALPRWRFPFAPHDLGTYPLADGQVYGGGEQTEENQMPVEESGNLLILADALAQAEGDAHFAERYWPQLTKWAQYLKENGLDPGNQLTSDDFAGHLEHNANLAIKAIEGLAAYADLAHLQKKESIATEYRSTAKVMVQKWITMDLDGDHYKLAYNSPGTWSQKYNLVWDQILGYDLFPKSVRDTEVAFYIKKINPYGLPLFSRADYTKVDSSLWTATLASEPEQFNAIVDPIYKWMNETPSRVPLTDWYDTNIGKQMGFQARSVVGGVYIKALSDPHITAKWRAQAKSYQSPNQTVR